MHKRVKQQIEPDLFLSLKLINTFFLKLLMAINSAISIDLKERSLIYGV